MDFEKEEILTTDEAAKLLGIKPSTLHKYVKQGEVKPVYEDNWHIDNTKLFYKVDIEKLKVKKEKPGLTTGEAASLLGLSNATIFQYIQQGLIKAEKHNFNGRDYNFIDPAELERFKVAYEESKLRDGKEFYDKSNGYAWFQEFFDSEGDGNNYILVDDVGNPFLKTWDKKNIPYDDINKENFRVKYTIPNVNYKTKKGFAKFTFREDELLYNVMQLFYTNLGPKNIKIFLDGDKKYSVEVKPILLKGELPEHIFNFLKGSIIEGSISKRLDGIYIDSDLEIIQIGAPSKLKSKIKRDAENSGQTMEEFILNILKEKYKEI